MSGSSLQADINERGRQVRFAPSPHDTFTFNMQSATAAAHFFAGRYPEAPSWAERAIQSRADFVPPNIVAAASPEKLACLNDVRGVHCQREGSAGHSFDVRNGSLADAGDRQTDVR